MTWKRLGKKIYLPESIVELFIHPKYIWCKKIVILIKIMFQTPKKFLSNYFRVEEEFQKSLKEK